MVEAENEKEAEQLEKETGKGAEPRAFGEPSPEEKEKEEKEIEEAEKLRSRWTIAFNSLQRQNPIGYPIVNLKLKLREERESQIHIPSWKLHFVPHFCS